MSVIEELWYGNIEPCEDKGILMKKKLVKLMARYQATLSSSLKNKEVDALKKYAEFKLFEIEFRLAIDLLYNK